MRRLLLLAALAFPAIALAGGPNIASAPPVRFGVPLTGTTKATDYWAVPLRLGDAVKITWGNPEATVSDLVVFPAGTNDQTAGSAKPLVHDINNRHFPKVVSTFSAEQPGTYPIEFYCGGACSGPGQYTFVVDVLHQALLYAPHLASLPLTGQVKVFVRTPDQKPITDPALSVEVVGVWRDASYVPPSDHVLGKASPKAGVALVTFHVPPGERNRTIGLHIDGVGKTYAPVSTAKLTVRVSG
jgi:hypothetical protein